LQVLLTDIKILLKETCGNVNWTEPTKKKGSKTVGICEHTNEICIPSEREFFVQLNNHQLFKGDHALWSQF
jgi:hypothetical protein